MSKFVLFFLVILAGISSSLFAQPEHPSPVPNFESSEHVAIGDSVKLRFNWRDAGKAGLRLKLANGLELTYGEIVSLAGDYYGLVDTPISLGPNMEEKKKLFIKSYETLANDIAAVQEVAKILEVIRDEQTQIDLAIQKGDKLGTAFIRMEVDHYIAWNCITGGMCITDSGMTLDVLRKTYFMKQGRFLKLSDRSFDHFGVLAFRAYSAGHEAAMAEAIVAGHEKSLDKLKNAYAMNAFACHYLSDIFAAGHMRTPRWQLYAQITPASVGSLLASFMHREDGDFGLVVSNKRGDTWKAYGDGNYYESKNDRGRAILKEAMQISADEVFMAFITGEVPPNDVWNLVPDLDALSANQSSYTNHSPLFYWDPQDKKIHRRNSINDVLDYSWTTRWVGWMTLMELIKTRGIPEAEESLSYEDMLTLLGRYTHNAITPITITPNNKNKYS